MGKVVGALGLLFAIVGGFLLFGQYFAGVTHAETGVIGTFLDNAWLIVLLFLGVIVVIGGVAIVKDRV